MATEDDVAYIEALDVLAAAGYDVEAILAAWSEPHRKYHNLDVHLRPALIDAVAVSDYYGLDEHQFLELVLMVVYHDYVYVVGDPDSESSSAMEAIRAIKDPDMGQRAFHAILGTKGHRNPPSFLAACLYDIDLAGLGREVYERNRVAVRDEYGITDDGDPAWVEGRIKFLQAYTPGLGRPHLFHTSWGAQFETHAYFNMDREMRKLTAARSQQ